MEELTSRERLLRLLRGEPIDRIPVSPRVYQNVVFELGYFIGKLTRARVSAIRRGDMEGLSDFGGVEYIPWDAVKGTWRNKLGQELQAAGFPGLKLDAVLA